MSRLVTVVTAIVLGITLTATPGLSGNVDPQGSPVVAVAFGGAPNEITYMLDSYGQVWTWTNYGPMVGPDPANLPVPISEIDVWTRYMLVTKGGQVYAEQAEGWALTEWQLPIQPVESGANAVSRLKGSYPVPETQKDQGDSRRNDP